MEKTNHMEDIGEMHRVYEFSKALSEIQYQKAFKDWQYFCNTAILNRLSPLRYPSRDFARWLHSPCRIHSSLDIIRVRENSAE